MLKNMHSSFLWVRPTKSAMSQQGCLLSRSELRLQRRALHDPPLRQQAAYCAYCASAEAPAPVRHT